METIKPAIAPFAIAYNEYRYLYPPRPTKTFAPALLTAYDTGMYFAQPKLNGSNVLIFLNEDGSVKVMNRHNETKTKLNLDLTGLYSGHGWMILNGELMEKSKKDENSQVWNNQLVIFDILAYNGYVLTGSTFQDRLLLLSNLFGIQTMRVTPTGEVISKPHLYTTSTPNVWRVISYETSFYDLYKQLVQTDMMEGLVLKRKTAILETPFTQTSNSKWLLKCRKETKIYKY